MIRERILQTLDRREDTDQRKLAHVAGINESSISRFLHGQEEINFEAVVRMVKYLYPHEELEVMKQYIPTQKSRNARYALEYCTMNQIWDQVDDLINLLMKSTNPVDKEWAAMYELVRMRRENLLPSIGLLQQVETFKPKEPEMQILKTILKGYLYFDMNEHYSLALHIEGVEDLIKQVKSTFIRESFMVRLGLIMNMVYLYANNLDDARRYSYAVIGQDFYESKKGAAYNNLGQSFMFEDYYRAEDYLSKALNYFTTYNLTNYISTVQQNLSFLNSYWGYEHAFTLPLDNHRSNLNYVYHLIKKGEQALAQMQLTKIDFNTLGESDKAYYYYYKGLLIDDSTYFYNSIESFLDLNDYFQLQLPLTELERLGENEKALKIISKKRGI